MFFATKIEQKLKRFFAEVKKIKKLPKTKIEKK